MKMFWSLQRKIVLIAILTSMVSTVIVGGLAVYSFYSEQVELQKKELQSVQEGFLPPLVIAAWNLDDAQVKAQVMGILKLQTITGAEVSDRSGAPIFSERKSESLSEVTLTKMPLIHKQGASESPVGTLKIEQSNDYIWSGIRKNVFSILMSEIAKVVMGTIVLVILFGRLVTNDLVKIVNFLKRNPILSDSKVEPLELDRSNNLYQDEIDDLVTSINAAVFASFQSQLQIVRLKERAEHLNHAKTLFLANMSHELRTPLNSLVGLIHVLGQKVSENEDRKFLNTLEEKGRNLIITIGNVLDYSRLENNELRLEFRRVELKALLQSLVDQYRHRASEKGIALIDDLPTDLPEFVDCDGDRVTQILGQVLDNAIKFTNKGYIDFRVRRNQNEYTFTISDTGVGMSDETLAHAFEMFYQGDDSREKNFQGSGVGLSLVKALVELMGGKVRILSELSKGTTVNLIFEMRSIERNQFFGEKGSQIQFSDLTPQTILVADDVEENRFIIQYYLSKGPYKLIFAENGQKAVEAYKENKVDLVLMDLAMPLLDGYKATELIRVYE
ncbi:MAG TPA: ATP-binding protein, partial [Pseudobdellovibrionaceae bacterium]|nr:ATP-binding protein [Pseudobdellovibrionaceae bacterium]